jgi:hypothetical protein
MNVTPPGDALVVSTQLRLVDSPSTKDSSRPAAGRAGAGRKAKAVKTPRGRRVHWEAEWRLDATSRRVGRQGVAAARAALQQARTDPNAPDSGLSKAS